MSLSLETTDLLTWLSNLFIFFSALEFQPFRTASTPFCFLSSAVFPLGLIARNWSRNLQMNRMWTSPASGELSYYKSPTACLPVWPSNNPDSVIKSTLHRFGFWGWRMDFFFQHILTFSILLRRFVLGTFDVFWTLLHAYFFHLMWRFCGCVLCVCVSVCMFAWVCVW